MFSFFCTKSICIPAGTGSGMVIPVSSLCCWKAEGLVELIPFISPLSVIQSSPGTQVTHTLQWAASAGEADDTLKRVQEERSWERGRAIRCRDKRLTRCRKGSHTLMMRLMDWLNLPGSNVWLEKFRIHCVDPRLARFWDTLSSACDVQLIFRSSPL